MKGFIFYKIGTYLLLFAAGFLAISTLMYLPMAFAQPSLLLLIFLFVCTIVYTYTSYRFMSKGMVGQMTFKKSFRDLIKVNGFGTLLLTFMILSGYFFLMNNPVELENQFDAMLASQNIEDEAQVDMFYSVIYKTLHALAIYAGLLTIHFFVTLRLLKKHAYLFDERA